MNTFVQHIHSIAQSIRDFFDDSSDDFSGGACQLVGANPLPWQPLKDSPLSPKNLYLHRYALPQYLVANQSGMGTIEVVLILVVLIALVLVFKDNITKLLDTILGEINTNAAKVWN
ncbi:MAG: Flp1 family type IVb pilin [Oribacterium sp.]|jgi:hypothetical protein|nr:Flp1 family type IVb pilin [Oribacterium sp.]MDY6316185.1 Flp1 family type IVb pilin [Oribacterium sp.]